MKKSGTVRKILVYAFYIIFFVCFQVSFPEFITFSGQIADLMLVFVVLVSYFYGFLDGAVVGIITGFLRDYYSAPAIRWDNNTLVSTFGIGILIMFLASVIASSFFTIRMKRNILFAFLCVIVVTLIYKVSGHLLILGWMEIFSHSKYDVGIGSIILSSILPSMLLNLISAVPVMFLLRFLGPYRRGKNPRLSNERSTESDSWLTI